MEKNVKCERRTFESICNSTNRYMKLNEIRMDSGGGRGGIERVKE